MFFYHVSVLVLNNEFKLKRGVTPCGLASSIVQDKLSIDVKKYSDYPTPHNEGLF